MSSYAPNLAMHDTVSELLKLYLTTSAFVIALYTLVSRNIRLRAIGENILLSLIILLIADILIIVSSLSTYAIDFSYKITIISIAVNASSLLYIGSFIFLFRIFIKAYNQIYNLRTNKVVKYFKPIKIIMDAITYKRYEIKSPQREINQDSFKSLRAHLTGDEIKELANGGSILITGPPNRQLLGPALQLMHERLVEGGETINYICSDQHPYEVWKRFKSHYSVPETKHGDIVFIDAYSPSFSFSEDIQQENSRLLSEEGIKCVSAKTFAGLHTAVTKAWNIIKSKEYKAGRGVRRPMLAVYARTSALCEFESIEQFRIFWWHVLPSEKSYGVTTLVIEDDLSEDTVLNCLKQRVDYAFKVEAVAPDSGGSSDFQITRIK